MSKPAMSNTVNYYNRLPVELKLDIVRQSVHYGWVCVSSHDVKISYLRTHTPRQLLQVNRETANLTESVMGEVYKHSPLRVDMDFLNFRGRQLGVADAGMCTPPEGRLDWKNMATWCGSTLMIALQGISYAREPAFDRSARMRFNKDALSLLVDEAVRQQNDLRASRRRADDTPIDVVHYQLRVFLADAIPQLHIHRAIEVTMILGRPAETSGEYLEGSLRDLRYIAERLAVCVTLHVRCNVADRQEWEAWFGKTKGALDIEYSTVKEWRAARPTMGPTSLWLWWIESKAGERTYMGLPDLMH